MKHYLKEENTFGKTHFSVQLHQHKVTGQPLGQGGEYHPLAYNQLLLLLRIIHNFKKMLVAVFAGSYIGVKLWDEF